MPEEHRGRLDRAIDRAVHEMVRADPRPGLRHRVEGRIHAGPSASMRNTRWQVPALAAAAVLVVVLGSLVLLRSPHTPEPENARVAAVEPSPAPSTEPSEAPGAVPASSPSTPSEAPAPVQTPRSMQAAPRAAEQIFGARSGLVRAADAEASPEIDSLAAPDAERFPGASFGLGSPIEPLAPITITPIRLTPIVVSPVIVNALPGGK